MAPGERASSGGSKMEVSQRQNKNKRRRGRGVQEGEPCRDKMAWADEVATESGFAPASPVGPAQAGVPWKAPCFGGRAVVGSRSMLGITGGEEADSPLPRPKGSSGGCPPRAAICPQELSLPHVGDTSWARLPLGTLGGCGWPMGIWGRALAQGGSSAG